MQIKILLTSEAGEQGHEVSPVVAESSTALLEASGISLGNYVEACLAQLVEQGSVSPFSKSVSFWVGEGKVSKAFLNIEDGSFFEAFRVLCEMQELLYERSRDVTPSEIGPEAWRIVKKQLQRPYSSVSDQLSDISSLRKALASQNLSSLECIMGQLQESALSVIKSCDLQTECQTDSDAAALAETIDSILAETMGAWAASRESLLRRTELRVGLEVASALDEACLRLSAPQPEAEDEIALELTLSAAIYADHEAKMIHRENARVATGFGIGFSPSTIR